MFTSLRRITDVRALTLAAALLLSGCAVHHSDAGALAAPSPATDEPVTANNAVIDRRLNLFM